MRLTTAFTALVASTSALARTHKTSSSSHSHPHPVVVYLHPQPLSIGATNSHFSAPLYTSDQADAVLAHHLGGKGEGQDEYENLPGGEEGGEWVHLMMGKYEVKSEEKARVVIIQGDMPHSDLLPHSLSKQPPSFYLSWDHESHEVIRPYINRAKHVAEHILEELPDMPKLFHDIFDMSTSATSALLNKQLQALSAIASRIPWFDRSRPSSNTWESIMVTALGSKSYHVEHEDEVEEEVKIEGMRGVKAALEAMTTEEGQPPVAIIFLPSDLPQFHYKLPVGQRSWIPVAQAQQLTPRTKSKSKSKSKDNSTTIDPSCFPSNRTCALGTSTCSGNGACFLSGNSTESKTGECWSCKCSSGYLGKYCEKADYVFQTILLIFTPLLILVVVLMSVGLLSSVGGEKLPSTLNVSVGVPSKRD